MNGYSPSIQFDMLLLNQKGAQEEAILPYS